MLGSCSDEVSVLCVTHAGDVGLTGELQVGDEILSVNGEDFTGMTHFDAWNRLKAMPPGPLCISVNRT